MQMMTMYISPNRRMANLRNAMDRLMEETMKETSAPDRELLLAVDVQAVEEAFVIRALVPGLEAENLDIEILNNTVTIRGEFNYETTEDSRFLTCELPQGRFGRVINLPVAVESENAKASLKNGVLVLEVPKAEIHRPKAIKITDLN
jgi:HSP20 family protein